MDTRGCKVSDFENIDFHWENIDLNMDTVFRLDIDTPFPYSNFNEAEMESMVEGAILFVNKEDNDNSKRSTLVAEGLNESLASGLCRAFSFLERVQKLPLITFMEMYLRNFCLNWCM